MLQQWEADALLHADKVFTASLTVGLMPGADEDYPVESASGDEHFVLDVWRPVRNPRKARFQLRYRRDIILARLCTSVPHTNPDGEAVSAPHLHWYREDYSDKFARVVDPRSTLEEALEQFCEAVKLPVPYIQGGAS